MALRQGLGLWPLRGSCLRQGLGLWPLRGSYLRQGLGLWPLRGSYLRQALGLWPLRGSYLKKPKKMSGPKKMTYIQQAGNHACLLYTSPSPRDLSTSRMPSSA